jgi:serine/threonine protein kinase
MTTAETIPSAESLIGRRLGGRYLMRSLLGVGGMGQVYRATQAGIEREVAVKVLRPELAHHPGIPERFLREARAAALVQHPNAITVLEFGEDSGVLFLAMELLYGEPLIRRLRRGPLDAAVALDLFEQVAAALAAAHDVGVIHRDLKPENIFLARFGSGDGREVVKVLDFGLAKLLEPLGEGPQTDANQRIGTPRYMAPEQAYGIDVDARCDVYALGLLLFEMLTGRPAFDDANEMAALSKRLRAPAPKLNRFSGRLDELVQSMLRSDKNLRPSNAGAVLNVVRALRSDGKIYRSDDSPPEIRVMPAPLREVAAVDAGAGDDVPLLPSSAVLPAPPTPWPVLPLGGLVRWLVVLLFVLAVFLGGVLLGVGARR